MVSSVIGLLLLLFGSRKTEPVAHLPRIAGTLIEPVCWSLGVLDTYPVRSVCERSVPSTIRGADRAAHLLDRSRHRRHHPVPALKAPPYISCRRLCPGGRLVRSGRERGPGKAPTFHWYRVDGPPSDGPPPFRYLPRSFCREAVGGGLLSVRGGSVSPCTHHELAKPSRGR